MHHLVYLTQRSSRNLTKTTGCTTCRHSQAINSWCVYLQDLASMWLRVQSQDGSELHFKVTHRTKLRRLLTVYCERKRVEDVRLTYDGDLLCNLDATCGQHEFECGDVIQAMEAQMGD